MIRACLFASLSMLIALAPSPARQAGEAKSDDIAVPEGKEFKLNKDTITISKEVTDDGRHTCTIKPAKEPTTLKMKAQKWKLGFTARADKKDQVVIDSAAAGGPLTTMRPEPKLPGERGEWGIDPGDIITHVNGYAVKTAEDVICAVNQAEDPADIAIVIKDINNGSNYVFYVSAEKK